MQARHGIFLRKGDVEGPSERPDVQRNFDKKDGGDGEGDVREDGEPDGLGFGLAERGGWRGRRGTRVREEGIYEVGEHTGGVDHDLHLD